MGDPVRGIALEQEDVMHAPYSSPATGYLDRKRRYPGLLAAAVVLHVGALGAVLSYHPEIVGLREKPLQLLPIPPVVPPPPPAPRHPGPEPRTADPRPQPHPDTPGPRIPVLPIADPWPDTPPLPPFDPGSGGDRSGPIDPPLPPVLTGVSSDPRYARDIQPPYPPALERLEIEGSVTVRVQIGTDGRVMAVELVKTDDPAFFSSTRDWALRRWRFKPATRDGEAVISWLTRTVHFRIVRDRNG